MLTSLDLSGSWKPDLSIQPHLSHKQDNLHAHNSYNDNKNRQREKQAGDTKYVGGGGKEKRGVVGIFYYERAWQHQVARAWHLYTSCLHATLHIYPDETVFGNFFWLLDFLKRDVFWYQIYLLLVNWCCHSVEPCALMCPFKGSQGNPSAFFFIKQNTPQGRSEVIFDLLLLLETLVSNSCLRVYYLKSIWIWFLSFRPESKWVLAVNYSSRQCRAPTN